jgi:uncharacterized membrane protein YebE (DUF533 family)
LDNRLFDPAFDEDRSKHFVNSLHAIAKADGITTGEELEEIEAIIAEFGLATKATREPGKSD